MIYRLMRVCVDMGECVSSEVGRRIVEDEGMYEQRRYYIYTIVEMRGDLMR